MEVISTQLPEVKLISPKVYYDNRGFFVETFQCDRYAAHGIGPQFVQDNLSYSRRGILRGLHLQYPHPQGKLVSVLQGEVFDVAVDIRVGSPNFGQWVGETLSAKNKRQLWIPEGFAHGFCVMSDAALLTYKCTNFYHKETDMNLRWDDPDIGIAWPISNPELSNKDAQAPYLADIKSAQLPPYYPKFS
ncbi:dTDP-4-dehydrorhamnose 3,5-epimerase [Spirulina sp. CCNP1310]|uniref:dTDP-4-dehydrorhamnose 3,5-epimerase n=1 Tax=Spirulina sp. CCNP1310 TaxID=3110249 RepID=UPI002B1F8237|nr:dTDP-4-dehydrorhamnose 3,5-epimerase [Spirulina sp. CCNP1310]MEA5420861.1 dTDP-4-dehydrorhamnose 3,5-epimerase [Spirulina sp. CCNP1310]